MTFGHEFTGIVEEVGAEVQDRKAGDHVLVPFNIACRNCHFCKQKLFGNCHESNPEVTAIGGIFGYRTPPAAMMGARLQIESAAYGAHLGGSAGAHQARN